MSESSAPLAPERDIERLLTFEHDSAIYAIPIAEVHEVAEVQRICCVPTIPSEQVGVMNWHGDALPIVAAELLFDSAEVGEEDRAAPAGESPRNPLPAAEEHHAECSVETGEPKPEARRAVRVGHVLVVSARDDEPARLGLPVDRVLGLIDGPRRPRGSNEIVVERRPLDGRVVNVLDPCRLVARATEVIGSQTA